MKCPNCGAESQGKFCEYCGSEMPQENSTINITNNYYANEESHCHDGNYDNVGKCPKCGKSKITFKRERISTTTQSRSRKNYIITGRQGHSASESVYRTIGICQNCGYTWNPNEAQEVHSKKNWLWILGWIFIFPIPLTILLLRKKDMKPAIKYGIIAIAWLLFFLIGIFSGTDETVPNGTHTVPTVSQVEQSTEISTEETEDKNPYAEHEKNIRKFVDEFNAISTTPITKIEFTKNHTIAYLVIDGFDDLSIKVNDHNEMGFFFTFDFTNGMASLEKYENLMRDIVKVFDSNIDVGGKFQKANKNQRTIVSLSDTITVEYQYIKEAVGFRTGDSYIITLTSTDYNKQ